MNKQKLFWKIPSALILFLIIIAGCGQRKTDGNIKWISKYNFFDLYKTKVNDGFFNPGSAITIKNIVIPDANTIILIAVKEESQFPNPQTQNNRIVIFASKDRGKSYKEIPTGEENFEYLMSAGNNIAIEVFTMNSEGVKKRKLLLFNTKTFELKELFKYDDRTMAFRFFDGKYAIAKDENNLSLINLLNLEEKYLLPTEKIGNTLYNMGEGKLLYKKEKQIREYNARTKEDKIVKILQHDYDYFFLKNGEIVLEKKEHSSEPIFGIYDLNENKLYTETPENKNYYRYKNFICDTGNRSAIRFSYDYGKTWRVHNVKGFSILQNIFGFYKDEFLVTEGIFFHGDSPESGGRIMVGEFQK